MKRINRLLNALLCMCCLIICGCSAQGQVIVTTDDYTIIKENDQFFMEVTNKNFTSSAMASEVITYPTYRSVSDMKDSILNNSFTQSDYHAISVMAQHKEGKIPLFNLDVLYEPMLPDGMKYKQVTWLGERYFFNFSKGDMSGSIHLINREMFDQYINEEFTGYFDSDNRILDKTEQDWTRGGTVYFYHTSVTSLKVYMHVFSQGEKMIYVRERYWNQYSDSLRSIFVWGFDGENYYEVVIHGIEDVPTTEWYLSFGLVPCVEDTTT